MSADDLRAFYMGYGIGLVMGAVLGVVLVLVYIVSAPV